MANRKLTVLPELTSFEDEDWGYVVDKSDTSESPQGTSKKARNSTLWDYIRGKSDLRYGLPSDYAIVVYIDTVDPSTATIFDDVNPPVTNDPLLEDDTSNLYIGTDSSTWVYDGSIYTTKVVPATSNFYVKGTIVDAGNNKDIGIIRSGGIETIGEMKAYVMRANFIHGINATENTIAYFDAYKDIKSLPLATYPSLTELSYVKGVTSPVQTQLAAKQNQLTEGTNITIDVTDPLNPVISAAGGGGAVDSVNGETGVVVLDTGDISEATDKNYVTDAELVLIGNISGLAPLDSPALTGIPTAPTATIGTNTTQLATTEFVLANATFDPSMPILGSLSEPILFQVVNQYDPNELTLSRGIISVENTNSEHSAHLTGRKSRGTYDSPLPVISGDYVAGFTAEAWFGSVYKRVGNLAFSVKNIVGSIIQTRAVISTNDLNNNENIQVSIDSNSVVIASSDTGYPVDPIDDAKLTIISKNTNGVSVNIIHTESGTYGGGSLALCRDSAAAVLNDERLGGFFFGGAVSSAHTLNRSAAVIAYSEENWTPSSCGSSIRFFTALNGTTSRVERVRIANNGNVSIGLLGPGTEKLHVVGNGKFTGSVQIGDNTAVASASNVGAIRYRTSGNNSYSDMCMQTGASIYAWVNIMENNW